MSGAKIPGCGWDSCGLTYVPALDLVVFLGRLDGQQICYDPEGDRYVLAEVALADEAKVHRDGFRTAWCSALHYDPAWGLLVLNHGGGVYGLRLVKEGLKLSELRPE